MLLTGDSIRVALPSGRVIAVRALIQGDTVYARADHKQFDALQLVRHELTHPMIDSGEIDVQQVYDRMVDIATEENMKWLVEQYAMAYGMAYDTQDAALQVFTEIICDSQADMNAFAEDVQESAADFLPEIKKLAKQSAKTTDSRGPPADVGQRFSRAQRGRSIELETMENNRFERLRQFHDDLPAEWYAFTGKNFYIYSNQSFTDYTILTKTVITAGNRSIIKQFVEEIKNGAYGTSEIFDSWVTDFRSGRGRNLRNRGDAENRGAAVRYGRVDDTAQGGKNAGNSAESSGTGKVKQQFSMERVVEETKTLVAMHNFDEQKIRDTLALGAWPSPSIAIVKANQGHTKYGEFSAVFPRNVIDPEADYRNKVYGSDAWTPTNANARVEYEVDYAKRRDIENKIAALSKEVADGVFYNTSVIAGLGIDDVSTVNASEIAQKLANNDTVRAAYLADRGDTIETIYQKKTFDSFGNDFLQSYIDRIGEQRLASIIADMEQSGGDLAIAERELESVRDAIIEEWVKKNEWRLNNKPELREKRIAKQRERITAPRADRFIRNAWDYYENYGANSDEVDRLAMSDALRQKVSDKEVQKWVLPQLEGMLGEPGIYNGKEPFDSRGNRKPFSKTHYPYSAENIVRAMNETASARGEGYWGAGAEGMVALATPEYGSVEEIHADEKRLVLEDEDAHKANLDAIDSQIENIIYQVKQTNEPHSSNTWEESEIVGSVLMETAKLTSRTVRSIQRAFAKEGYTLSDSLAKEISTMYRKAAEISTGYFEAKPQRVVQFNEATAILSPDNTDTALLDDMRNAGMNVVLYEAGNEQDRLDKLNYLEDVRFSREETTMEVPYGQEGTAEDDASFVRRMHESARKSKKVGEITFGFSQLRVLDASGAAADARSELKRLGIKSFLHNGLEYNYHGRTYQDKGTGGALPDGSVAIYGKAYGDGIEIAGHEAFHVWKNTPARGAYADIVKANINITTSIYGLQQADQVLKDYFGGNIDAIIGAENEANRIAFAEELYARISGQIHSGAHEAELRTMFRDYDMVKAAWDELVYSQTDGKQNANYSREMPTVAELQRENRLLQERLEYWKGQTQTTRKKAVRLSDVDKVAKGILGEYESKADFGQVRNAMKYLADDMLNDKMDDFGAAVGAEDSMEDALWNRAHERAVEIARNVVTNANRLTNEEMVETGKELRKRLRNTPISLENNKADFADFNDFRKRNVGNFLISDKGTPIETLWHDLQDEFGEGLFPDSIDNPADQMLHLEELMGSTKPEYANPFRGDMAQNVESCANAILDQLFSDAVRQTAPTFADRQAKKLAQMDAALEKSRSRIKQLQEEKRAAIADLQKQHREQRKQDRLNRQESADVKKYREKVEKHAKSLMDMMAHPTKEAHVPTALNQPLQELLNSIDFDSQQKLKGGEATIRDVAYTRALDAVKQAIAAQRTALDKADGDTFTLDVPPDFLEAIDNHKNMIVDATKGMDLTTNRVYEMTSDELRDLSYLLGTINKAIRDIDKLHMAGAKARVSELGRATQAEMKSRKAVKGETGNRFMWGNYTPYYAFRAMGTSAQQIFKGLTQGQAKLARTVDSTIQFAEKTYTNKEVQEWEGKKHTIQLDSGETVQMTTAQIMSFYCLSGREQAKGHMMGGGIRIGTIKNGLKDSAKSRTKDLVQKGHYTLTIEDINRINNLLTDRQKEVARKLQKYMQDVGGRLGNEISMARWDYMQFTEDGYFPIKTDDATRDVKNPDQDKSNLWAMLNKSFTKSLTKGANNAVVVGSIFDVFADHMSEMAEYNAFALPLVDAMKWFNYRERIDKSNGQIEDIGVQRSIRDTLGSAAVEYFVNLMTDINSSQKAGRHENMMGQILSRYKVSSVGWNLRVAIQQPTAILRASMMLDAGSLVKGTFRIGTKELVKEM